MLLDGVYMNAREDQCLLKLRYYFLHICEKMIGLKSSH